MLASWDAARSLREVEVKKQSERTAANLPPELKEGDLEVAVEQLRAELVHDPLEGLFRTPHGPVRGLFQGGQLEVRHEP